MNKKKLLSAIIAAALAVSPMAAFAETSGDGTNTDAIISENVSAPAFITGTAAVDTVEENLVTLKDNAGELTELLITDEALIINSKGEKVKEIKAGDEVTYYVRSGKPAVLKLPVQYNPDVVVVGTKGEEPVSSVKVDNFKTVDGEYISSDGQLVVNADITVFENADGSIVTKESLEGKDLCVIYSMTTRSIPPITTPDKVYILPSYDELFAEPEYTEDEALTVTDKISANGAEAFEITLVEIDGRQMLPVRAVSEALGLEVGYDGELEAVTVGTVQMGVSFNIGTDAYSKSRMTPFVLGQAPVKVIFEETGVTYVPVEFFTDVLEAEITVNDGVTYINR